MSVDARAGQWVELNRANWDERVPIHLTSEFYDVDRFVAGAEALRAFELDEVGDVHGKRLLHLLYPRFHTLTAESGQYRLPPGQPRVPLLLSLRASKPDC
ncbi:hypothetical protein [Nocardia sp. BSTN01]|uniref:hypothetical protein n=1 Tax=Nocardia sp. BSTN01 TaxID=2783665 RepID=UPI001E51AE51|nr:hypothetical protein [Nocardia sp. BSTN01]